MLIKKKHSISAIVMFFLSLYLLIQANIAQAGHMKVSIQLISLHDSKNVNADIKIEGAGERKKLIKNSSGNYQFDGDLGAENLTKYEIEVDP